MKLQILSSCKLIVALVGIALWTVVGPTVAMLGTLSSTGHNWSFFQAYSWLGGQQPGSWIEPLAAEVTTAYWVGTVISLVGFFTFLGSILTIFKGGKTYVFWLGLIILSLASVTLFSMLWYTMLSAQQNVGIDYYWKLLVPPIVGSVVFILIGLYMMKSGTQKEEEGKTQLLSS